MTDIPEFGTPRPDEERRDGGCAIVFDPETQQFAVGKDDEGGLLRLFSGGVDPGEDIEKGITREVVEESGLHDFLHVEKIAEAFAHYHNRLKKVNRVAKAACYLVILKSANVVPARLEPHEKFRLAWTTAEKILENWKERNGDKGLDHWIYFLKKSMDRVRELGYDKADKRRGS